MKDTVIKKKICLLGSFAVGKTSLVERFVYERFEDKYLTTLGVKISQKLLPPVQDAISGSRVRHAFLIWDIASSERFDQVARNYYRGAAGAIAVADLTRPGTIQEMLGICGNFRTVCPRAHVLVLGNKLDVFDDDQQTLSVLKQAATRLASDVLLTSAKTGHNVEEAFVRLSKQLGNVS